MNGHAALRATRSAIPEPLLDVERLAEAIFRIGTGYRDRATATIPGRIANSQDGARASGEFAAAIAAEYLHLSATWPLVEERKTREVSA